ncbi:acyl-CoA-binding domain-containing protein 5-B [Aplochiton taeniatus]
MAQEDEDKSCLEERFHAAVRVIRSLPEDGPYQPSDDMMLMFYSYYKQATLGPCNMPRPNGFWDTAGKAKWDAWSSLGKMTKHEAMQAYVDDIQLILETIPVSEEVSDLVEILGNFFIEVDGGIIGGGGLTSLCMPCLPVRTITDPRLLMVEGSGRPWRSDTRGSGSSVEPSSSSVNGTHSSLNSEVEEEELACSVQRHRHLNGHRSDCSADKCTHRSNEHEDSEEFCDSMEHLAMEEVKSRNSGCNSRGVLDEQVAMALLRLQDNMANVLHRLQSLESRTSAQFQRPSWWPFHLSPISVVLTMVWPLLAHWLLKIYLQRKRRKIN